MKYQITFLFCLISFFSFSQTFGGYTEAELKQLSKAELQALTTRKIDSLTNALESKPRTVIGSFTRVNGEKVDIYNLKSVDETIGEGLGYSDYSLSAQFLYYHNKEGKVKKIGQTKIATFETTNNYYTRLKIGSAFGFKRLHRRLIETEDHILTEYFSHGQYFYYLYDKANDTFIFKKEKGDKVKKNRKLFDQSIKPYFKNCSEFISLVEAHLSKDYSKRFSTNKLIESNLFLDVSNLKCE